MKNYSVKSLLCCVIFFALSLSAFAVHAETAPAKITLGIIPGGSPDLVKKESLELAQKIQTELGIPVEVVLAKTYGGLLDLMKKGEVQFGFLTANSFVQAEKEISFKVLLKKTWAGAPFYFSTVITRADSKIKKVKDLKGKKIAFVDKGSTSGYLYPKVMLQQNEIKDGDFSAVEFSGNHAKSVALLEQKQVDAIATFADNEKALTGAWTKFASKALKVQVLWVSQPIPNDPIVVTGKFYDSYPKFTHNFMSALINIQDESKNKKEFRQILGDGDLLPATEKHFEPVREMVKQLKL